MRKQAEEWLEFAISDLRTIEHIIEDNYLTNVISFHSQQCIEKCFKALIENCKQNIPRTHDLRRLLKKIESLGFSINIEIEILDQLNQVYIDTRYPADFGILPEGKPSINKSKEFAILAQSIYKQTCELLT